MRTNKSILDRFREFERQQKDKETMKAIYTITKRKRNTPLGAKWVIQHKSGVKTYLKKSAIINYYGGGGVVVKEPHLKMITYYKTKYVKIMLIE